MDQRGRETPSQNDSRQNSTQPPPRGQNQQLRETTPVQIQSQSQHGQQYGRQPPQGQQQPARLPPSHLQQPRQAVNHSQNQPPQLQQHRQAISRSQNPPLHLQQERQATSSSQNQTPHPQQPVHLQQQRQAISHSQNPPPNLQQPHQAINLSWNLPPHLQQPHHILNYPQNQPSHLPQPPHVLNHLQNQQRGGPPRQTPMAPEPLGNMQRHGPTSAPFARLNFSPQDHRILAVLQQQHENYLQQQRQGLLPRTSYPRPPSTSVIPQAAYSRGVPEATNRQVATSAPGQATITPPRPTHELSQGPSPSQRIYGYANRPHQQPNLATSTPIRLSNGFFLGLTGQERDAQTERAIVRLNAPPPARELIRQHWEEFTSYNERLNFDRHRARNPTQANDPLLQTHPELGGLFGALPRETLEQVRDRFLEEYKRMLSRWRREAGLTHLQNQTQSTNQRVMEWDNGNNRQSQAQQQQNQTPQAVQQSGQSQNLPAVTTSSPSPAEKRRRDESSEEAQQNPEPRSPRPEDAQDADGEESRPGKYRRGSDGARIAPANEGAIVAPISSDNANPSGEQEQGHEREQQQGQQQKQQREESETDKQHTREDPTEQGEDPEPSNIRKGHKDDDNDDDEGGASTSQAPQQIHNVGESTSARNDSSSEPSSQQGGSSGSQQQTKPKSRKKFPYYEGYKDKTLLWLRGWWGNINHVWSRTEIALGSVGDRNKREDCDMRGAKNNVTRNETEALLRYGTQAGQKAEIEKLIRERRSGKFDSWSALRPIGVWAPPGYPLNIENGYSSEIVWPVPPQREGVNTGPRLLHEMTEPQPTQRKRSAPEPVDSDRFNKARRVGAEQSAGEHVAVRGAAPVEEQAPSRTEGGAVVDLTDEVDDCVVTGFREVPYGEYPEDDCVIAFGDGLYRPASLNQPRHAFHYHQPPQW